MPDYNLDDSDRPERELGILHNPSAPHTLQELQEFTDDAAQDFTREDDSSKGGSEC